MASKIRVLVADDHPLVRQGLEVMLLAQDDLELVGMAADGEEAVRLVGDRRPDVLVLDLRMPKLDGLGVILALGRVPNRPRVVVLTGAAHAVQVQAAMRAGARAFVDKQTLAADLVAAIRAAGRDATVPPPPPARAGGREGARPGAAGAAVEPLTPRELDVLRLLARGLTNREIAERLAVNPQTVLTHVRSILEKLQVTNRTRAALYAREHGLA